MPSMASLWPQQTCALCVRVFVALLAIGKGKYSYILYIRYAACSISTMTKLKRYSIILESENSNYNSCIRTYDIWMFAFIGNIVFWFSAVECVFKQSIGYFPFRMFVDKNNQHVVFANLFLLTFIGVTCNTCSRFHQNAIRSKLNSQNAWNLPSIGWCL